MSSACVVSVRDSVQVSLSLSLEFMGTLEGHVWVNGKRHEGLNTVASWTQLTELSRLFELISDMQCASEQFFPIVVPLFEDRISLLSLDISSDLTLYLTITVTESRIRADRCANNR